MGSREETALTEHVLLQEVVDDLRAEIATARSVLQVLKTSVVA